MIDKISLKLNREPAREKNIDEELCNMYSMHLHDIKKKVQALQNDLGAQSEQKQKLLEM